jgi:adenosylcobinamide kinase / adenosylcobinamide-phosphate guanylyltransferase
MTNDLVFVTGGARSGKSAFALEKARAHGGDVTFVATAQAFDFEMRERIARHKLERYGLERHGHWTTLEEPRDVPGALERASGAVVLDCLSIWVTNLMLGDPEHAALEEAEILAHVDAMLGVQKSRAHALIVVSNEVGSGVVPKYPLGRAFRDALGRANQTVARAASEAYLIVAGLPLKLK